MKRAIKDRIDAIHQNPSSIHCIKTEIGILPCDWKIAKLSDIAEKVTQTTGTDYYETVSISAGIGFVNQAQKFGKELSGKQYEKYNVLHKGDFSYNKGNSNKYPQGCIYRLKDRETAAVPNVFESFKIQSECADFYDHMFVSGFLNQQLSRKINHGIRDNRLLNLTEKDFYSCLLPVPPLTEQKKISKILDHCDKLIKLCKARIDEYKSLKKTCLSKMFPRNGSNVPELRFPEFTGAWEQRELGELADIVGGGMPSTSNINYWDGEIDWYAPAEISEKIYVDSSERKITKAGYENSSAKMLPVGTVLFTSRAVIGKTSILRKEACTNQGFQSIIPHKDILDSYFIFSRAEELKRYGETIGAGSTFVEVSGKQMASMKLMMPKTINEQKQIGQYFQTLDRLITLHQCEADEYARLKKAMMQLLLTGIVRLKA